MTQPPTDGALAFRDARGCKEWLGCLPLTNIPQAQALVLEGVRALEREAGFDPLERLKCLELVRDKVAFLQGEQRSRYFGKTLPLSANDASAWITGRALLEEMESGYRRCLELARGGPLAAHAALIAQRIVRHVGAQMMFHAIVYRRFDPQLWERLHQDYAGAERLGNADEILKDSLESDDSASTVTEAYVRVVLVQAAYLSELTAPQMDFVEALLRLWVRRVAVRRKPAEGAPALCPLVVDFGKPIGARPQFGAELTQTHRVLDIDQLSRSLRKRIHGLQAGEDPAALGLPSEFPTVDALHHLKRLHKLWCEGAPPRPPAKVPAEKNAGLAFGVPEIHFFVSGGKVFEQPDKKRELTSQEKQDIEVFGRVTERTQTKMVADHNYTVESWGVIDEMLGAWRLLRPGTASRGIAIGRLVAMRVGDTAPFFLGHVTALSHETDGRFIATVTLFPGRPEPIAARPGDARNRANAHWSQAFRLPPMERMKVPSTLVVASGVASRGRGVEVWDGSPRESTVEEVLDRGTDFDRISVY